MLIAISTHEVRYITPSRAPFSGEHPSFVLLCFGSAYQFTMTPTLPPMQLKQTKMPANIILLFIQGTFGFVYISAFRTSIDSHDTKLTIKNPTIENMCGIINKNLKPHPLSGLTMTLTVNQRAIPIIIPAAVAPFRDFTRDAPSSRLLYIFLSSIRNCESTVYDGLEVGYSGCGL